MEAPEELNYDQQAKLLEEFIFSNKELEKLESIVDKFNVFLSLGIINAEIRHSYFLSWILSPEETHGLGDYFLKLFLKTVVYNNQESFSGVNIIELDSWDFDNTQVLREWNNIDILIVDETLEFVCVIENKVDSKEHSNQLTKYRKIIEKHYPDYNQLFIYLTVSGEKPEKEQAYASCSYTEVASLIETMLESKVSQLSAEVNMFISHYHEMIKRFIMEESDVQAICEKIYKKHKKAIDLIIKYKPDIYADIKDTLVEIIDERKKFLNKDYCSKSYIRFMPKELDFIPKLGGGWVPSNRMLLFEIQNYDKAVGLALIIGPGPNDIRQKVFGHVKDKKLFNKTWSRLPAKWSTIYKIELAKINRLDGKSKEELKEYFTDRLDKFFAGDYLKIKDEILQIKDHF